MGLQDIDSLISQTVDDQEIICKHIRSLVIFGRNVLSDRIGQGNGMGAPKWNLKDIASKPLVNAHSKRVSSTYDVIVVVQAWERSGKEAPLELFVDSDSARRPTPPTWPGNG
jgi:hypothetical protein